MASPFASMRFFNYRLWFGGSLVSSTAVWLQRVAQDWYVLTVLTDHDSSQVGIVTALQFLPILGLSGFAGALADRVKGRRILQSSLLGVCLVSLCMGVLILTGVCNVWHMYALAVASGVIIAIDTPARQAFVGELVPRTYMANAVALNATAFHAARLIGPAVAGLLIEWYGVGPVSLATAVLFLIPILTMALMRAGELVQRPFVPRAPGQVREALAYVRGRTDIRVILLLIFVVSALGMNFQMTSALMATEVFGKSAGQFGVLSSFMAVGSILGAVAAAARAPRIRTILCGAALYGLAEIGLGMAPTYWWFAALSVPTGLFMLTTNTSANAYIQTHTDEEKRGRVMSLYSLVFLGATPVGSPLIGWVGQVLGARWSILVGGMASMGIAVVCGLWAVAHWGVRLRFEGRRPRIEGSR